MSISKSVLKLDIACAPIFVRAAEAEVAPVPPFAIATVPDTLVAVPGIFAEVVTSFVVGLYNNTLVLVALRIGAMYNAFALSEFNGLPVAFNIILLACWLAYPANSPIAMDFVPWSDAPAALPIATAWLPWLVAPAAWPTATDPAPWLVFPAFLPRAVAPNPCPCCPA